jgi:metal-responsive CopG/Arc/MetJ family transcriptional regulator
MKTITIHLDKKLLRDIKLAAKLLNITLSEFVTKAIKHKLQELENDRQI